MTNLTQPKKFGMPSWPQNKYIRVLAVTTVIALVTVWIGWKTLTFQTVEVFDLAGNPVSAIDLTALRGKDIFWFHNNLKDTILAANPHIEDVEIKKSFPGKLTLTVFKAQPVVAVQLKSQYLLLSRTARVIERVYNRPQALGIITTSSAQPFEFITRGAFISQPDVSFSTLVASELQEASIAAYTIHIVDQNLIEITLPASDVTIKMTSVGNASVSGLSRLREYLKTLYLPTAKNIRTVDLRFEKTIIEER